jgi:hypothetical protein
MKFAKTLHRLARAVRAQESLAPLQELDPTQLAEVARYFGPGGASPEGVAHAVEAYLASLKSMARVARAIYFNEADALERFEALAEREKGLIERIMEEAVGDRPSWTPEEARDALCRAILAAVEARMSLR